MGHIPHLLLAGAWDGPQVPMDEKQRHHLTNVLRWDVDDPVTYTNGVGIIGEGTFRGDLVIRGAESEIDRPKKLVAAVAPPASKERQKYVVEKLAELGVERLTWLETTYGSRRPPRTERADAWSAAALEQSRGGWLMTIDPGLATWADLDGPIVACDIDGNDEIETPRTVAIGPEGGWANDEIPRGVARWALGPTVLRVETAAVVAVSRLR